jgi:hypothetical protein
MKIKQIPFIIYLLLTISFFPMSLDYATSVVPGWHTTIFPPFAVGQFIVVLSLVGVIFGYYKLSRRTDTINWKLFIFHFILTIPLLILLKFDTYFSTDINPIITIPVSIFLFIVGQITFLLYCFKIINTNRKSTETGK